MSHPTIIRHYRVTLRRIASTATPMECVGYFGATTPARAAELAQRHYMGFYPLLVAVPAKRSPNVWRYLEPKHWIRSVR